MDILLVTHGMQLVYETKGLPVWNLSCELQGLLLVDNALIYNITQILKSMRIEFLELSTRLF